MKPERFEKLRTAFGSDVAKSRRRRLVAAPQWVSAVAGWPIRAGMSNLVAAIVRNEPLEVTAEDGLPNLDVALRAS